MSMSITSSRAGDAAARNGDASARARRSTSVHRSRAPASSSATFARRFASSAACRKNARNRYQPLFVVSREGWRVMTSVRSSRQHAGVTTRGGDIRSSVIHRAPRSRAAAAAARHLAATPPARPPALPTAGGRWPARGVYRPSFSTNSVVSTIAARARAVPRRIGLPDASRARVKDRRAASDRFSVSVFCARSSAETSVATTSRSVLAADAARDRWLADAPRASPRSPRAPSPRVVS